MEYNNTTVGVVGVDRIYRHLTNYPVTKKKRKKYYKKNILPLFGYIVVESFCFIPEVWRKITHLRLILDVIDRLIKRHGTVY